MAHAGVNHILELTTLDTNCFSGITITVIATPKFDSMVARYIVAIKGKVLDNYIA